MPRDADSLRATQRLYVRMGFERAPELDWEPAPGVNLAAYRFVIARGF